MTIRTRGRDMRAGSGANLGPRSRDERRPRVSGLAVTETPVETAERERRIVTPAQLRPKVDQTVAGIDLTAAQRQEVDSRNVDAGLAGDRDPESGLGDESPLALAEEPSRIAERIHLPAKPTLERQLGAGNLLLGRLVLEGQQVRMRDRMRLEAERSAPVQLSDLVPREQRRLAAVPAERGGAVDYPGR